MQVVIPLGMQKQKMLYLRVVRDLSRLTFGELEAGAGAALAIFFPFFFTGIAGQQTGFFERQAQFRIHLLQGLGNTMHQGIHLRGFAAALDRRPDIEFLLGLGHGKGPDQFGLKEDTAKILFGILFVDVYLTAARGQPDPGNCALSLSCSVITVLRHDYQTPLNIQLLRLLGLMGMFTAGVYLQLL